MAFVSFSRKMAKLVNKTKITEILYGKENTVSTKSMYCFIPYLQIINEINVPETLRRVVDKEDDPR